ncbi:uncharacterized protein LAJ45_06251 [Morchella importuna]|uniref:uncharacterized protein n=1 Tax=Morchella importuna TaxID=1174673 RepID=UPI001E8ED2A3|nr:uncharacterized protein LAJ45_06251 [Morchella importuna]KAH8149620.1 hypothetical protein LAJ45_06251 [Morchella importuna]
MSYPPPPGPPPPPSPPAPSPSPHLPIRPHQHLLRLPPALPRRPIPHRLRAAAAPQPLRPPPPPTPHLHAAALPRRRRRRRRTYNLRASHIQRANDHNPTHHQPVPAAHGRGTIAQQQSIYDPAARAAASSSTASGAALKGADGENAPTVLRQGGGQTWTDGTLLEWDPSHFRLFVGNLAGEVTDDSLLKAFAKYPSVQKARVIRDKRTTKSKGYGFVAFSDGDEYFRAAREMNGKYIGSHPVLLKRSNTEIKPVVVGAGGRKGKEGGGVLGGRVEKKKKKKGRGEERNVLG